MNFSWKPKTASGRRKGWAKHVTSLFREAKYGWALNGDFLSSGDHDLPLGSVIVDMEPAGSVRFQKKWYTIYVLEESGLKEVHFTKTLDTEAFDIIEKFLN